MLSKIRVNILRSKFMFIFRSVNSSNEIQCSPYQAETGKNLPLEATLPTACNGLKVYQNYTSYFTSCDLLS